MSDLRTMPYVTVEQVHRFREAALAEIQRLRAMVEWRPIESAPRDGTNILLYFDAGTGTKLIGYYSDGLWYEESEPLFGKPKLWLPLPPTGEA